MRKFIAALIALLATQSAGAADGELAWTELSFCNDAGYCVRIDTGSDRKLKTVEISRNGVEMEVPDLSNYGEPNLSAVRLVSVEKPWGFVNRLEIPFFGEHGVTVVLTIEDDKVDSTIQVISVGDGV